MCCCACTHIKNCVCVSAASVSMAGFSQSFFFILVFLFFPLGTPPCITALRLLRSLFLGFLIDMQQPTSLNDVFYAPWSSALSAFLMFPFLGWLNDIYILPLTSSTSRSFLSLSYDCTSIQNRRLGVHRMNDKLYINHCTMFSIGSLFVQLEWDGTQHLLCSP